MHVALIALLGCSTPDPYAPIEAELGESIAPEDRAGLPARGAYVLVLPDRLVVGSVGWDAAGLELEPEVRERLVKVATLPLVRGSIPRDEMRGQLFSALYDVLLDHAETWKDIGVRSGHDELEFRGDILLFVDPRVLSSLVREVMFTAGQAQFGNFRVLAVGPRLSGAPTSEPEPLTEEADPTHRSSLSPLRTAVVDGKDAYVIDDRTARIRVDTLAGAGRTSTVSSGSAVMAELRKPSADPILYATYAEAAEVARYPILPSIEMVLHVSKHLDDALMADLQRAREPVRRAWVESAIAASADQPEALAWLEVARELAAGERPAKASAFLDNPLQSMPVGIYGESDDLGHIYRRDRWLGQDLFRRTSLRAELVDVLKDPVVLTGLTDERAHRAVWTNPAYRTGLEAGGDFLISPARSHETTWVDEQGGTSAVPEPMEMWIAALQAGSTSIALAPDSGWYDRAQWALEPLLTHPDRVSVGPGYGERLKKAFMAGVALRRETQVKDLSLPGIGAGMPSGLLARVAPELRVEPVPTHWERSAEVYAWLGRHALSRGELPERAGWAGRVDGMRALYAGLAEISQADLGVEQGAPDAQDPRAATWLAGWSDDPVLSEDMRVFVPFGPGPTGGIIGWGVLGVTPVDLVVTYETLPTVTALDGSKVTVIPREARYTVLVPHFTEVQVARPLTRTEFREIGDRSRLASDFVRALKQ